MKKLINRVDDVVRESLDGVAAAHSDLVRLIPRARAIVRRDLSESSKVALVSGGGSGHEPLHVGFVGYGMLDAACAGEVFTSPTPDRIYEAAKAVHGGNGLLLIVKNYTGDVMNFRMAAEMLSSDGIQVEQVVIGDDVSVMDSIYTAGRRGVGGALLVEKVAGACAEAGASLAEVKDIAQFCSENVRSMGMALTSCTVPSVGRPTFDIADDEMELGIGIHGEPGCERKKMTSASEIVTSMADAVCNDLPFCAGDEVIAFVNGMGGTPLLELYIVYHELVKFLEKRSVKIVRSLVGNYVTSLDMQGCSITLLRLNKRLKELWDAPVHTPALRWGR